MSLLFIKEEGRALLREAFRELFRLGAERIELEAHAGRGVAGEIERIANEAHPSAAAKIKAAGERHEEVHPAPAREDMIGREEDPAVAELAGKARIKIRLGVHADIGLTLFGAAGIGGALKRCRGNRRLRLDGALRLRLGFLTLALGGLFFLSAFGCGGLFLSSLVCPRFLSRFFILRPLSGLGLFTCARGLCCSLALGFSFSRPFSLGFSFSRPFGFGFTLTGSFSLARSRGFRFSLALRSVRFIGRELYRGLASRGPHLLNAERIKEPHRLRDRGRRTIDPSVAGLELLKEP